MNLSSHENMVVEEALAVFVESQTKRLDEIIRREPVNEGDMEFQEKFLIAETKKIHEARDLLGKFAAEGEKIAEAEMKAEAFFRSPDWSKDAPTKESI